MSNSKDHSPSGHRDLVQNRRARHDYEILETFESGIVLQGTEIKSLRNGEGSIQESYIDIKNSELWLVGSHIPHYMFGNIHNHEEKRPRKLLMHKREIAKLRKSRQEKGMTLVALSIYLKSGRAKLRLGVARGKQLHDKRQSTKERDVTREIQQRLRS
jgi:SsrA-binding protein